MQFGGATAVSVENSFHYGQINGAVDRVIPQYRRMAAAIHAPWRSMHGPAHPWRPARALGRRQLAAGLCAIAAARARPPFLSRRDGGPRHPPHRRATMRRRCGAPRDGDLDGVEISTQAGTLIEQFWSPAMNMRTDRLWRFARQSAALRLRGARGLPRGGRRRFPHRHPHAGR